MALGLKGAYNDVVAHDGIGYDIDALPTIPHHVAFNNVRAIYVGIRNAVRQDAWIICVVYYIVSNDVAPQEPYLISMPSPWLPRVSCIQFCSIMEFETAQLALLQPTYMPSAVPAVL